MQKGVLEICKCVMIMGVEGGYLYFVILDCEDGFGVKFVGEIMLVFMFGVEFMYMYLWIMIEDGDIVIGMVEDYMYE